MKYARTEDNMIYNENSLDCRGEKVKIGSKWVTLSGETDFSYYKDKKKIIAVANDPRELIQVGDLTRKIGQLGLSFVNIGGINNAENIIEIWTKTNENTYTCQWRAEQ